MSRFAMAAALPFLVFAQAASAECVRPITSSPSPISAQALAVLVSGSAPSVQSLPQAGNPPKRVQAVRIAEDTQTPPQASFHPASSNEVLNRCPKQ